MVVGQVKIFQRDCNQRIDFTAYAFVEYIMMEEDNCFAQKLIAIVSTLKD